MVPGGGTLFSVPMMRAPWGLIKAFSGKRSFGSFVRGVQTAPQGRPSPRMPAWS